ncbi:MULTISPECIES: hypothetical protein [unclassified Micromonospora]|uniref:hypothetical protein n=1 Tax=unclassified Micromonospora TaxID=2617518 RepID=UPI00332DD4F7
MEETLAVLLEPLAGGELHTGTETPADLDKRLPFIRVVRPPGGFSDQHTEYVTVNIDVFHSNYRSGAKPLAERVRQFLTTQKHRLGPAVIDTIVCTSGPGEMPWAPGIRRVGATYQTVARRYRADT